MTAILAHGYIPHVKGRKQENLQKQSNPNYKARRWIVAVAHSGFNRFRKLWVRYEKSLASYLALNHLAATIITLRKVKLNINIIYG